MLTVAGSDGPLIAHVPVLLSPEGDSLDLHLVRSNSIARLSEGAPVVAVAGPDAYVPPTGTRCPTSCRPGTMSPSTCAAR
nr:FMN-binding negative transcriptional regulator [Jannaschia rubra]